MKLRTKIYFSILFVSLATLFACSYYLINQTHLSNIRREQERSLNEYDYVTNILSNNMLYPTAPTEANMLVLSRYIKFYADRGINLMIFRGEYSMLAEFTDIDISDFRSLLKLAEDTKKAQIIKGKDRYYFFVSGKLTHIYTIVYARDITEIYQNRTQSIYLSLLLAAVLILALSFLSSLYSRWLTRPIVTLQKGADAISGGDYSVRLPSTKDEFHSLSEAFNAMAAAVESRTVELTERAKELQVFIDDLSHEMNTPLTSIQGYSEFLLNANASGEQKQKAADTIRQEAKRMKDIYTKLMTLTFAREHQPVLSLVDIPDLYSELGNIFALQLKEQELELIFEHDLTTIEADRTLLQMLLSNLIKNSIQVLPPGGRITLKAFTENNQRILEVSDNGPGIPNEYLQDVTKPFFRVDKSRSRRTGGVGLGLSICQNIAKLHQAELVISSQLGLGTRVQLIFP